MERFDARNRAAWYFASLFAAVRGHVELGSIMIELALFGPLASA